MDHHGPHDGASQRLIGVDVQDAPFDWSRRPDRADKLAAMHCFCAPIPLAIRRNLNRFGRLVVSNDFGRFESLGFD